MGNRASAPELRPGEKPGTFQIRNWRVFSEGIHNDIYFAPADVRQMAENFRTFCTGDSPWWVPKCKLGHQDEQTVAESMGLPNVGQIVAVRLDSDGWLAFDIDGIPGQAMALDVSGNPVAVNIAEWFANGNYNDASVELRWKAPDPRDPAKLIPGAVIDGLAFLGDERPAVPGSNSPKLKFAGRSGVIFKASASGPQKAYRLRLSEVRPMSRDEMIQKLTEAGFDMTDPAFANLPDDALRAMLSQTGGENFMAKFKSKFVDDPTDPAKKPGDMSSGSADPTKPDDKEEFRAMFADLTKRMGAMEAAIGETKRTADDVQFVAKFAASQKENLAAQKKSRVEFAVAEAVRQGRLMPTDKEDFVAIGLLKSDTVNFAAGDRHSALDKWLADLATRPVDPLFHEHIDDTTGENGPLSATTLKTLSRMRTGPARAALANANTAK